MRRPKIPPAARGSKTDIAPLVCLLRSILRICWRRLRADDFGQLKLETRTRSLAAVGKTILISGECPCVWHLSKEDVLKPRHKRCLFNDVRSNSVFEPSPHLDVPVHETPELLEAYIILVITPAGSTSGLWLTFGTCVDHETAPKIPAKDSGSCL